MTRRFEYHCTSPSLPRNATSPMMDFRDMEKWLNFMDEQGWELVCEGQKWWHGQDIPQSWWIFRRPVKEQGV